MKISAVINSYNSIQFLEETVRSVQCQSRLPEELIIIDDGSTDGSYGLACQLAEGIPYARVLRQENGGQLSCISYGVEESKGDLIAILDSDDLWEPEHLATAALQFETEPRLSLYYSAFECFGSSSEVWTPRYGSGLIGQTSALCLMGKVYVEGVSSSLVIRASTIRSFFPFPQVILDDWRINADNILIWITSLNGGFKFANTEATIKYRKHAQNRSKKLGAPAFVAFRKVTEVRFFEYIRRTFYLNEEIAMVLADEYLSHENPHTNLKKEYLRTLRKCARGISVLERVKLYFKVWKS